MGAAFLFAEIENEINKEMRNEKYETGSVPSLAARTPYLGVDIEETLSTNKLWQKKLLRKETMKKNGQVVG